MNSIRSTVSPSSFHRILDAAATKDTIELEKFRQVVDSKCVRKQSGPESSRVARARATAAAVPQQMKPGVCMARLHL